jgi:hypothetical protein
MLFHLMYIKHQSKRAFPTISYKITFYFSVFDTKTKHNIGEPTLQFLKQLLEM